MTLDWQGVCAALTKAGVPPAEAVLAGSVPMLAHGLIGAVGDVDVVVPPRTWQRLAAGHRWRTGDDGDRIATLPGAIELFDGWYGERAGVLAARADARDGWALLPLTDVLAFKERLGRPKDLVHLPILRRAIEAPRSGD